MLKLLQPLTKLGKNEPITVERERKWKQSFIAYMGYPDQARLNFLVSHFLQITLHLPNESFDLNFY